MEAKIHAGTVFLENKYTKWYWNIIERALSRKADVAIVTERHHILPKGKYMFPEFKSLKMNKWNGVDLTLREHFLCHLLLTKMTTGVAKRSCIYGLMRFSTGIDKCNGRKYESARRLFSETRKGDPNPHKGMPGRSWSEEEKAKHSFLMKKVMSDTGIRQKCSKAKKGKPGNKHTEEFKIRMSVIQKNLSPEQRARKSESKKGEKNGCYGRQWITDGTVSKLVPKSDPLPVSWWLGRVTSMPGHQRKSVPSLPE